MISNVERIELLTDFLNEYGVLNAMQSCRLINGFGVNEYSRCYFTFKEKPKGSANMGCRNRIHHTCEVDRRRVLYSLMCMAPPAGTVKMRFWDSGGIGTDLFRFFYLEDAEFKRQILDDPRGLPN